MIHNEIKIHPHKFLDRGTLIHLEDCRGRVYMNTFDFCNLMFEGNSDYKHIFEEMGVVDDAIEACVEQARKKLEIYLDCWKTLHIFEQTGVLPIKTNQY